MSPPLLVYYGHDPQLLPALRQAKVLVFEARGWSPQHLAVLRQPGGPRLLGYLSPLAWPRWAGPYRWWWGPWQADPTWDARWYSLAWPGWRRQVRTLARQARTVCHGLFLDNLDRLRDDPRSLPHLERFLSELRRQWPDVYLLGNRGFAHWDRLAPLLDGVLVENLSDRAFTTADRGWLEQQLRRLEQPERELFALDYATRCLPEEAARLRELFPRLRYYLAPDERLQSLPSPQSPE